MSWVHTSSSTDTRLRQTAALVTCAMVKLLQKLKSKGHVALLDPATRLTKAQHAQRENVNYLWQVGLSRALTKANDPTRNAYQDPVSQEAVGRLLKMPCKGLDDQAIALFCSSCKSVFLPGINCTVRTLTKSRKKHEFRKKKLSRKSKHGSHCKYINKGLVYTCSLCGNRETVGIAEPTKAGKGKKGDKIGKNK